MLIVVAGCSSSKTDPALIYQNQSEEQIFRGGEINLVKHNYATAAQQFEALDALYPFDVYAEQAQLDLMYAYFQTGDVASTAATAERFLRIYPRSEHIDYAYYMKGLADFSQDRGWIQRYFPTDLSQRDPGTTRQAFADFSRLVQEFPNSPYAADARQRMIYLRNLFATYELHVAEYYMRRHAYVAAANRAAYVVQHYDGTPQEEDALGIMVQAYRMLGLDDRADQTMRILQLNYPQGSVLRELAQGKPLLEN